MNDRSVEDVTRRHVLRGSCAIALSLSVSLRATEPPVRAAGSSAIHSIRVGSPIVVPDNFGDTWVTAWADDDRLYTPSNDTLGFGIADFLTEQHIRLFDRDAAAFARQLTPEQRPHFPMAPFMVNGVEGNDPHALRGVTVNRMDDYTRQDGLDSYLDSVASGSMKWPADGRLWKTSGCTFIDGALYVAAARHKYPDRSDIPGIRQAAAHASLIKSTDYGRTWTRSPQENLAAPMFPGPHFATPYFVEYGKTRASVDGADRFVYAISNNGFWDNGDWLVLGRVARERIGRLHAADWEFFTGGDGLADGSWTRDVCHAKPILERPGRLGATGAVYLPARQRYLMIGWYYPSGSGYLKGSSSKTEWDFYEAPHPWGPWNQIGSYTWSPHGYYCPVVCPKFQSAGRVYVVTAGDFKNWWDHYHLTFVPVDLS